LTTGEAGVNYYFLDRVPWELSQTLYHAAAYLNHEALFILRPATPYVCIGFHQDAEQEIDLDFVARRAIPVFRREVGGGAVYLDGGQLFYQLVLHRDRPVVPADKAALYRRLLEPVVETFREFGVLAEYKPVNDILANGRKVSGNGAGEIEGMVVLVGNFILDFDFESMSHCLRVPDEKFRDKVFKTLQENLSTMRRESGRIPETRELGDSLAARYEAILGPMGHRSDPEPELLARAEELLAERHTPEWLHANDRRRPEARQVKIREGVFVTEAVLKTPGGLVRATAVREEGRLRKVHLSGDFFFYPADALAGLERALEGVAAEPEAVGEAVSRFYAERSVDSPGLTPGDLTRVLLQSMP
jgi:lipoate-protein ligase A